MFGRGKTQNRAKTHRPSMSAFSAIFVLKENGTQSHSAKFLNWGDHVNSVPDLAATPSCRGLLRSTKLLFSNTRSRNGSHHLVFCDYQNEILTFIWSIQKEFSMGLKVRHEEDPRCHGPGRTFVWVQDSLLRNSIGQEKNHHDQKKIH